MAKIINKIVTIISMSISIMQETPPDKPDGYFNERLLLQVVSDNLLRHLRIGLSFGFLHNLPD